MIIIQLPPFPSASPRSPSEEEPFLIGPALIHFPFLYYAHDMLDSLHSTDRVLSCSMAYLEEYDTPPPLVPALLEPSLGVRETAPATGKTGASSFIKPNSV